MPGILFKSVKRNSLASDIEKTAHELHRFPKIITLEGDQIRKGVTHLFSSLFLDENIVLFLIDPDKKLLNSLKTQIENLEKKIWIVIYDTKAKDRTELHTSVEKDKEKTLKRTVLSFLRRYGKTMTDKAYNLFIERIKDDSFIENELIKLVNYVGEREEIRSKDVDLVVSRYEEENLISLFEAIKDGNKIELIRVLDNLMSLGMAPLMIHAYLCRIIRLLIQVKEMTDLLDPYNSDTIFFKKFSGLRNLFSFAPEDKKNYFPYLNHRYALTLATFANKISLNRLKELYNSLVMYDLSVKKGTKFEFSRLEMILLRSFDV
ncbi:MAG: hypothetical protein N2513_00675 [Deltaproteobacteria bacterium]|nr:hypothetical protein [Deltaproteobacteria bacterium]